MKTLLCIPGLGGHPSVFNEYVALLPEYRIRTIRFVNRADALRDARAILAEERGPATLFCHCYSAQMGIQLAAEMPEKVERLIFLEPFFAELKPWMKLLLPVGIFLLSAARLTDAIGLRRRRFRYEPDYIALAKYPIYLQPFFDMRWQNLTDYFDKCYDILTYRLPARVEAPTTMLFSPNGFSRDPRAKEKLKKIFVRSRVVEMQDGTHNVITMGGAPVAAAIRDSIK